MKSKYLKHVSSFLLFAALLLLVSCEKDNPPEGEGIKNVAGYDLKMKGSDGSGIIVNGEDVESNWDSELGVIWLGMDEKNGPLYTTITISYVTINDSTATTRIIEISTQDVLVGTGDEFNARLYQGGITDIKILETGSNYITGEFKDTPVQEVNSGDAYSVNGTFTALKPVFK